MTGVTAGAIIGFIGAAADFTAGFLLAAFRLAGFFFPAFFFAAFFLDFLAAFLAGFRFFADFFFAAFFFVDFRFVLRFFAFLAFFAVFFFAAFFFVAMVKLLFQCWTEWRLVPVGPATALPSVRIRIEREAWWLWISTSRASLLPSARAPAW
jgi:hypothetical protein